MVSGRDPPWEIHQSRDVSHDPAGLQGTSERDSENLACVADRRRAEIAPGRQVANHPSDVLWLESGERDLPEGGLQVQPNGHLVGLERSRTESSGHRCGNPLI